MSEILVNSLKTAGGVGTLTFDSTGDVLLTTGRLGRLGGSTIEIDSSGQFVGTNAFTGAVTIGDGLTITDDSATVATLNRTTSDGDIVEFQKDGSAVGSIGYDGAYLTIENPDGAVQVGKDENGQITYLTSTATANPRIQPTYDDTTLLGDGSHRWKGIYTSNGIFFENNAANHLDDYEEGTWTPQLTDDSTIVGGGVILGTYTKVGRLVHARFTFINPSTNLGLSGTWRITNLPFAISAQNNEYYGGFVTYNRGISMSGDWMSLWSLEPRNYFQLRSHYMNGSESTAKSGTVPGSMLFSGELIYSTS